MSVLACDRSGCDNIMCDRHSHEFGYICNECFEELVNSGRRDIANFMSSEKGSIQYTPIEFYNDIFEFRD